MRKKPDAMRRTHTITCNSKNPYEYYSKTKYAKKALSEFHTQFGIIILKIILTAMHSTAYLAKKKILCNI